LIDLDVLSDDEALDLLIRHLGHDRLVGESQAMADMVTFCGGLPLALTIVAARARSHPSFPLTVLVNELQDESARLEAFEGGDLTTSLTATLSWSQRTLAPGIADVFVLLGLTSGPDIGVRAAAALTGLPLAETRAALRELETASLVQQHVPDRYRMHDLVDLYAAGQAEDHLPMAGKDAALRRLFDFYLSAAYRGDQLLDPHRPPIEVGEPDAGFGGGLLTDAAEAMSWFVVEHPCILAALRFAAARSWHRLTLRLAWALDTFQWRRGHIRDQIACWQVGIAAAGQLADSAAAVLAHRLLGDSYSLAGRHTEVYRVKTRCGPMTCSDIDKVRR
jgi:hypothetical protein